MLSSLSKRMLVRSLVAACAVWASGLGQAGLTAQARRTPPAPARPAPASKSPTAPAADLPVPFKAGETLTFDVSWTTFVTAGSATLQVKERRATSGGGGSYYLVAEAQPSPVLQRLYALYYKAESFIDTRTLRPSAATLYSNENGRTRYKTSKFPGNGTVDFEIRTRTSAKSTLRISPSTLDPLGAIYVLRALPLKAGQAPVSIPITDSGRLYTMRVTVQGRESVSSGIGAVAATKLGVTLTRADGKAADASGLSLWLSDDARRLPVKISASLPVGSFQATLARVAG